MSSPISAPSGSSGASTQADQGGTGVWRFGDFELHVDDRRLLQTGQPVHLQARALDLLVALVERQGQLLRRSDILDTVWAGLVVEDNNINVQVNALRKVLGRAAIVTVPGYGYRLGAAMLPVVPGPARAEAPRGGGPAAPVLEQPADDVPARQVPDGPRQRFISRLSQSADLLFGDWQQPASSASSAEPPSGRVPPTE